MYKFVLALASLVPFAAYAESSPLVYVQKEPPGLSFRAPAPNPAPIVTLVPPGNSQRKLFVVPPNSSPKQVPGMTWAPLGKLPNSGAPLTIAPAPAPPSTKARLLVFRDDDRAATKVFHPLLTPDVQVSLYH